LTSEPVLIHADFKKYFFIHCDTTNVGIGAVLFQRNQDEKAPGELLGTEEWVAAILAIRKFLSYVEGMPFTCITNHASLKWLITRKNLSEGLSSCRASISALNIAKIART